MEKPKHKDGMLAAGKKRLEQFRQKKQGKGSASKHAKPETDLDSDGPHVKTERASSKGNKSKGSTHRTLSDDLQAANARSDSGRNKLSIDSRVVGADDSNSQINAEPIPVSVLDHCSAHASNVEENALGQCTETGQEKPQMGSIERVDSLEPSGLDHNGSPFFVDCVKAPVELESSVYNFNSSGVTMAHDSGENVVEFVVPDSQAANTRSESGRDELFIDSKVVGADDVNSQINTEPTPVSVVDLCPAHTSNVEEDALKQCRVTGQEKPKMGSIERVDSLEPSGLDHNGSPFFVDCVKAPVELESSVYNSNSSGLIMAHDLGENVVEFVVPDSQAANARSDSGRDKLSIDLKVVGADDANSQINADLIPGSVLDHCSAHASNVEENALEQHRDTGQEKPQMGSDERVDSLEPSGLDHNGSPSFTDHVKAPIESESSVYNSDLSGVTMTRDLSENVVKFVIPDLDANLGLVSCDNSSAELTGERIVMNSDYAEAIQACNKEQKSMTCVGSSAAACLIIDQPVELTAKSSTESGYEDVSDLHPDAKHIQLASFSSKSCSNHAASSQDFSLQSALREEEKDTSIPGHELNSGEPGILLGFNTGSANLEHMGSTTKVEIKEESLSSSWDAETAKDYLSESISRCEVDSDTHATDTCHSAVPVTEAHLSPIAVTAVTADAIELPCANTVMGLGSDEYSIMEQAQTGEMVDINLGSDLTGIPFDSNLNQVGLSLNDNCELEISTDDSHHDEMPTVSKKDMPSVAGREEVTVIDASEPADDIGVLNCVKEALVLRDLADDSCSITEDVVLVSSNKDRAACESVHISEEGLIPNVALDQNSETDSGRRCSSSEFHKVDEPGNTSRDGGVNAEWRTVVEPDQMPIESVHVEGIANLIEGSFSVDDLNCPSSLQILEAVQPVTGEDQILKASENLVDGKAGSAGISEVEEIVTSDALRCKTHEACILSSDSGSGVADITMPASAKIEAECKAASKPEVDMGDALHLGQAPSEEVQGTEAEVMEESKAALKPEVNMDEALHSGLALSGESEEVQGTVEEVLNECKAALKPEVDNDDALHSGLPSSKKSEEVQGMVEEVINEGLDTSIAQEVCQLQMDEVVEDIVLGQNLAEGVARPVIKMEPSSESNIEHEEYARPELSCSNQELHETQVSLDTESDEPHIAQCVVAANSNFTGGVEEVADALPGSSSTKHELDSFAMDAELSLSNTGEHGTDKLLSMNRYADHESENVSPSIKDDLPSELVSKVDVKDREADLESNFADQSQLSLDSGLTSGSNCAEDKVPVSDGNSNFGNNVEFIGRNDERGQESLEVSQYGLTKESCFESKVEHKSISLESCRSHGIASLVGEYALPLVMTPDETLEGETEHTSSSDVADTHQNDTVGLSFGNTQESSPLTGQLSRSFVKSDLPLETVQEHSWPVLNSRGFDESTLIEEAGFGNMINSVLSVGVSQHAELKEFEEQSSSNKTGGSISSGIEGEREAENMIRELQEALSMKETEVENYSLLLNFQAAKNNEERGMAEEVLTHIVKRLANLVSQGSSVSEDDNLYYQHLKPFDMDNGGLERADLMNLGHFLQASNYWMDVLQKNLEEKRMTEIMGRQLEDALLMKDGHIKDLTERVKDLSQSCDELQKDSEQMKDLETKAMQWEEQSTIKEAEIARLSDKVSDLSQNYDVAMDEVAKAVEERVNVENEFKDFQKLYAEQGRKASEMEELLSIKDRDLERLFDKVAELSQNYDLATSEMAKFAEERSSLAQELSYFQKLCSEQEEGRVRMSKQANSLADKIFALVGPSAIAVDAIHGNAMDTLESLVTSLQGQYEAVCRENKNLLLTANDSEAASQEEVNNMRVLLSAKGIEVVHLQEKVDSLTVELSKTRDDSERKVQEAEQKALGVRERLSLAVTKGKGLVQQRDNLKQLLAEKTAEVETLASSFKEELHLKTVALNEAEIRAKLNSEAVERVEALESELSYIRNSANALRESFLQKDAVLQKIEELFEDANLPEEWQIKDIYEKVEGLLVANTQKTSTLEGQDHSEKMPAREVNAFPAAEQGSQMQEIVHLNKKCDELLRKYRGMAEQSAMLEQSLLERNILIQKWEEMLDAVDMPASVRLKEPEDKIMWLGTIVSDAHTSIAQFQAETEGLRTTIEAMNNAFQKLQEQNDVLAVELAAKNDELKSVFRDLEDMTVKCNNLSELTYERTDVGIPPSQAGLQGLEETELKQEVQQQPQFQIEDPEAFVTNIRTLLSEIMQRDEVDDIFASGLGSTVLEKSMKLLVEKNKAWTIEATEVKGKLAELTLATEVAENDREKEVQRLHEALSLKIKELSDVTTQLDHFSTKNSLLENEVDNLQNTVKVVSEELLSAKDELGKSQLEASQLEDKLASTREKLSMAVKKGKSVVQQRDALRQSLDEKTTELIQIRKELEAENLAFTNAKQSLKHHLQQMETLEAELLSSRNYASSLEKSVQESNSALQKFAEAVDKISIPMAPRSRDLGEKIQWISQLILDLQRKAGISEQEAKKSKKTTELLALELEEVQGRMDSLAEELMNAEKNISLLIEEKKLAEASKAEAGLRLEHAMANVNSLLFELNESRENQVKLEQENNSLKDTLSAQMEEFRYKQTKAEDQLKDLSDLYSKVYHLKANQSTSLNMVADKVFDSVEHLKETKNLILRISGELKDQGLMPMLTAPMFAGNFLSKWQPEKMIEEWKQGVTTGSLKLMCDEMEFELQHFENFFKSCVTASHQDTKAISHLMMEICDALGPLSQRILNLKRDADFVSSTESLIVQKDEQIRVLEEILKAVSERLGHSIEEIEDFKQEAPGQVSQRGISLPHLLDGKVPCTSHENLQALTFSLVERLSSVAKDLVCSHQQDDIQKEKQNENLRNQLSKARAVIDAMDHQQQVDKLKNSELQKCLTEFEIREDILKRTNQELLSLNDVLSAEKQEKEGLIEALNNAEMKIGELLAKVEDLEKAKQELEASLGKASSRFYTTVNNFNRFQSLSEKLIEEAESLHLLLEDRDAQISLLKEEATLKGSEVTSLKNLVNEKTTDLSQLYQRIGEIVNRDAGSSEFLRPERQTGSREELLEALATSIRVGTEGLQVQLAMKDALLQDVQLRHDDLARKVTALESSLLENQRLMEERGHTSVIDRMMISVEAEDKGNRGKHVTPPVAVVTHGRGGRKVSAPSDHLALDVDTESSRLLADVDDEAKGHVFKPLTSSRLVPRGTRILVDRLDGLWVSGERLLRRRPGARLSVMLYWLILHIWMAAILL